MPDLKGERIHFVGVGGASMSALAEYCLLSGAEVSGSDMRTSAATERLAALGAEVYSGARRDIIAKAGVVVYSSAVPASDAELSAARAMGKRVTERHEFLADIAADFGTVAAVSGTHGKTTVTAMTAHILKTLGIPFVAHIGGEPVGMSNLTVCRTADGKISHGIFLTEACEFGRHLLALSPTVAVVTNMECDHPDCYATLQDVHGVFAKFVEKCSVTIVREQDAFICTGAHICIRETHGADQEVRARDADGVCAQTRVQDADAGKECSRMPECTYELTRILEWENGQTDSLACRGKSAGITLPYAGAHYAWDAAFAVALAVELGADFGAACGALATFGGVRRRYERAGFVHGAEVIFDYAHHPTELGCTLRTAQAGGRVLVVFQPHTYSRTASYMDGFVDVLGREKEVVIMPTYAARERGSQGASSTDLAAAIAKKYPECKVYLAVSHDDTWNYVENNAERFDKILFLGAGDIYELKGRVGGESRAAATGADAASRPHVSAVR